MGRTTTRSCCPGRPDRPATTRVEPPARRRRPRTHGAGSSSRAMRRGGGARVSTAGTSNAAKQSSPCAQVSIKRAVASDRAAMRRPPHGTRSRSSRSAKAASVASRASRHAASSSSCPRVSWVSCPPERGSWPSRTLAVAAHSDTRRCSIVSATLQPSAGVGWCHCDSSCASTSASKVAYSARRSVSSDGSTGRA